MKEQPIYKFVAAFMDRRMYYSIEIARIVGIPAAIMIHQIHFWQQHSKDPDKWTYKTSKDWESETALTDDQQQGARKVLKQLGFWEETLRGVPATKYYRLNLQKLNEFLSKIAETGSPKIRQPRRDKTANQLPEKQQTGSLQNGQLYKETEVTTEVTTEESAPSNAVAPPASEIQLPSIPREVETPTSKPKEQENKQTKESCVSTTSIPLVLNRPDFLEVWEIWMQSKKQTKKPRSAHELTLRRLSKYPIDFAVSLVELAVQGDYQGCIFSDTPQAFDKWKKSKNTPTPEQLPSNKPRIDHEHLQKVAQKDYLGLNRPK